MTDIVPTDNGDPVLKGEIVEQRDLVAEDIERRIAAKVSTLRQRAIKKLVTAALGGIPWIGGAAKLAIEILENPNAVDELHKEWFEHHARKLEQLRQALQDIANRLNDFGDEINERIESPEFLAIVENAFRAWDEADTEQKREYIRRLVANAAAYELCSDDLVRLFLSWIRKFDDTHLRVIQVVYQEPGIVPRDIWLELYPTIPKDNSQEADLFKLLLHDLSVGHIVRIPRETNAAGQFVRQSLRGRQRRPQLATLKSPFDGEKGRELTELGRAFVHYVLNEVVPRVGGDGQGK